MQATLSFSASFSCCGPLLFSLLVALPTSAQTRLQGEAARVTITRDDWGIAHIHGHSDADAVFGMIYAQCEDDFSRVEANYLAALGRTAEAEGEKAIWQDLRQRLFVDPEDIKRDYALSPAWLRTLMDAWADGLNFYLETHPDVHPKVLTHFEPWMALSFTEGSIGGDIEKVDLKNLQAFYEPLPPEAAKTQPAPRALDEAQTALDPQGSNGIAIAPKNTHLHHALLLINPHTTFFFRSELQMTSDEGLNAYGAVTWGQFFVYQGFNERAGWMHTSSYVDAVDEYDEQVGSGHYRYGDETKALVQKQITLSYQTPDGVRQRSFATYATQHGPVIRKEADGRWVSIQLMNVPIQALEQSYLRTKAHTYAEYSKTMELQANSSNNTVFADADGDIAYWHGDFIPKRDPHFDFTKPVDGTDPATDWHGLTPLDEIPHLLNPASGFVFNVNDSPWNGAGTSSLKRSDYPAYVEQGIESARGIHALRLLDPNGKPRTGWELESLRYEAFDSYMPWFARTIPSLLSAYDELKASSAANASLAQQIVLLRKWNFRWSKSSIPTSLAIYWGTELMKTVAAPARAAKIPTEEWVATRLTAQELLDALSAASVNLSVDFGTWKTQWGQVNRFQRLSDDVNQPFSDAAPSIPVPFAASIWGSLAAFVARQYPGTKRWYGTYGNSFMAVVEFGAKVRAVAITAGGESGHPGSTHFNDEAQRYADGNLRDVYFYPDQLIGHIEKIYRPGDQ